VRGPSKNGEGAKDRPLNSKGYGGHKREVGKRGTPHTGNRRTVTSNEESKKKKRREMKIKNRRNCKDELLPISPEKKDSKPGAGRPRRVLEQDVHETKQVKGGVVTAFVGPWGSGWQAKDRLGDSREMSQIPTTKGGEKKKKREKKAKTKDSRLVRARCPPEKKAPREKEVLGTVQGGR